MNRLLRTCLRSSAVVQALALSGCLSSAPPAPPVRWFDPLTPVGEAPARAGGAYDVHVVAAPYLGREFVVRTAEREVVFDGGNGWIAEPRVLVQTAVEQQLLPSVRGSGAIAVTIDVLVFELDVTAAPRAHVRLVVRCGAVLRTIDCGVAAADRLPASFAAAMAKALSQAASQVREVVGATATPPVER